MPDRTSDRMPEGMPDKVTECLPDRTPEDLPDRTPDRMSEDMLDRMPEDMLDRMPEDMSGRMPEDMPDRMPEDMSDRMREDLPVTRGINVMVGITRINIICFFVSTSRFGVSTCTLTFIYLHDFQCLPLLALLLFLYVPIIRNLQRLRPPIIM